MREGCRATRWPLPPGTRLAGAGFPRASVRAIVKWARDLEKRWGSSMIETAPGKRLASFFFFLAAFFFAFFAIVPPEGLRSAVVATTSLLQPVA